MRITQENNVDYAEEFKYEIDRENIALTKLKAYEDLDKQFGFSIIDLVHAKVLYKLYNTMECYTNSQGYTAVRPAIKVKEFKIRLINFQYKCVCGGTSADNFCSCPWSEYGKTWFLHKEEIKEFINE